jgi:hypothetical protein
MGCGLRSRELFYAPGLLRAFGINMFHHCERVLSPQLPLNVGQPSLNAFPVLFVRIKDWEQIRAIIVEHVYIRLNLIFQFHRV